MPAPVKALPGELMKAGASDSAGMSGRAPSRAFDIPFGWTAAGLLASLAVLIVLMRRAGLTIDPLGRGDLPFYLCFGIALIVRFAVPRTRWHHARAAADCAEYYAIFMAMTLMGAVACYPVVALTHGYADPALQRVDAALRFDWLAWYRTVSGSATLQILGTAAYRSIYVTPALLLAWFAGTGQRPAAHRFLLTFWLSAIITLALFAFMPAVGPLSYLWHAPISYMPDSELWQPDLIPQLRAGTVHFIDLGHLRGLVSAPSFHAAAATLFTATAWRAPRLRWPLTGINAAMLLATPVEGTHYLADILLGMFVALLALTIVDHLARRIERR